MDATIEFIHVFSNDFQKTGRICAHGIITRQRGTGSLGVSNFKRLLG
jgi:hypothetical protein